MRTNGERDSSRRFHQEYLGWQDLTPYSCLPFADEVTVEIRLQAVIAD